MPNLLPLLDAIEAVELNRDLVAAKPDPKDKSAILSARLKKEALNIAEARKHGATWLQIHQTISARLAIEPDCWPEAKGLRFTPQDLARAWRQITKTSS